MGWARPFARSGTWAPAPTPPRVTAIVPTSGAQARRMAVLVCQNRGPLTGSSQNLTTACGNKGQEGLARPARRKTPVIGTTWDTPDIWLRRELIVPEGTNPANIQLRVYHDEDIDGILGRRARFSGQSGYLTAYNLVEIRPTALKLLMPGKKFVLAVHCHQTGGGQGVDVGLVDVVEASR